MQPLPLTAHPPTTCPSGPPPRSCLPRPHRFAAASPGGGTDTSCALRGDCSACSEGRLQGGSASVSGERPTAWGASSRGTRRSAMGPLRKRIACWTLGTTRHPRRCSPRRLATTTRWRRKVVVVVVATDMVVVLLVVPLAVAVVAAWARSASRFCHRAARCPPRRSHMSTSCWSGWTRCSAIQPPTRRRTASPTDVEAWTIVVAPAVLVLALLMATTRWCLLSRR
jgi:hypothetical protein